MKRFISVLLMTSVILSCFFCQGCGILDMGDINDVISPNKGLTAEELYELISPSVIRPVQHLKVDHLGNHNPRLHVDEILIALAISAVSSKRAAEALEQLDNLKGLEAHSSVMLSSTDQMTFKKLGVNITCEPKYQVKKLYHSK